MSTYRQRLACNESIYSYVDVDYDAWTEFNRKLELRTKGIHMVSYSETLANMTPAQRDEIERRVSARFKEFWIDHHGVGMVRHVGGHNMRVNVDTSCGLISGALRAAIDAAVAPTTVPLISAGYNSPPRSLRGRYRALPETSRRAILVALLRTDYRVAGASALRAQESRGSIFITYALTTDLDVGHQYNASTDLALSYTSHACQVEPESVISMTALQRRLHSIHKAAHADFARLVEAEEKRLSPPEPIVLKAQAVGFETHVRDGAVTYRVALDTIHATREQCVELSRALERGELLTISTAKP